MLGFWECPRVWLTRGFGLSGRECGPVYCLKLDRSESADAVSGWLGVVAGSACGSHGCPAFVECVLDRARRCTGEPTARDEGVPGEVEPFEVVDIGVVEWLVAAGDAFSGEQVQYRGFGDAVSVGELESGGAVAVGVDEFVDGVARESALDVPGRLGLHRAG